MTTPPFTHTHTRTNRILATSPGPDHEAPVGEHARDAPVPEGFEGAARTYPAAGHHVPHRDLRTGGGRRREPHLCGHQGDSAEHTGKGRG